MPTQARALSASRSCGQYTKTISVNSPLQSPTRIYCTQPNKWDGVWLKAHAERGENLRSFPRVKSLAAEQRSLARVPSPGGLFRIALRSDQPSRSRWPFLAAKFGKGRKAFVR